MQVVYAEHTDPEVVVRLSTRQIETDSPTLVLAFCGGKHPPQRIRGALGRELGDVPVVGGAAAGAITQGGFGCTGLELALCIFSAEDPTPSCAITRMLRTSETDAGIELGRKVAATASDDAVVMLFYDSVASTAPLKLHPAAPIVQGFYQGLEGRPVHLVGGGLLSDPNLSDGWVFDGASVCNHCAIALVFPPEIKAKTVVMHGCRPASTFMEITRLEGAEVFELDGSPALHVLERMIGISIGKSNIYNVSLLATLGKKQGDLYAEFNENLYINRLILRVNREVGSLILFEPDFQVGDQVQIMARDNALMIDSVKAGMAEMQRDMEAKAALMSLYIDCAGRASIRSGSEIEEAGVALANAEHLGPFLGFYSGVEIAPVSGRSFPLDWTGVFSTLYRRAEGE